MTDRADAELVEIVARELVSRHGERTVTFLREMAETADEAGDRRSAAAWYDIADVAARIMRGSRRGG